MSLNYDEENKKIKNEFAKYEKLKKVFSAIYSAEGTASKKRKENFDKMNNIRENDNKSLKNIYETFTKEMKDLEDDREVHLKKINDLIIPVTEYYPTVIKESKKKLEDYAKQKKNTEDLTKSTKSNQNDINKSKNEEIKKRDEFDNGYKKYKNDMRKDNKYLFLQFIHSELKYHCAALERMSNLFFKINKIDPRVDIDDLAKSLRIENFNYQKELNIDMEDLKKKKKEQKNKEKEENDEAFKNDEEEEEKEGEEDDENNTTLKKSKKKSSMLKSKTDENKRSKRKDDDDDNEEEEVEK